MKSLAFLAAGLTYRAREALRMRVLHSERLAATGEMASRVAAHEVRNPLAVVTMYTELARRELQSGAT